MPYFVYKLFDDPIRRIEFLGEFIRYPEASKFAKAKRAVPAAKTCAVRVVYGTNTLAAEEALMNPREAPPRIGDDY